MKRKPKNKTDPKKLFGHAMGFRIATSLLAGHMTETRDFRLLASIFTNAAFAIELLLKCLYLITKGSSTSGHDLKILFGKLEPLDQDEIRKTYNQLDSINSVSTTIKKKLPHLDISFDSMLSKTKTAFVDWRYLYEEEPPGAFGLDTFSDAIRSRIFYYRPKWDD